MRIFKFVIFYSFVGIYETVLFMKSGFSKFKTLFSTSIVPVKTKETAPRKMKGALLKTAFRSIL